jgi:hypothetical protein
VSIADVEWQLEAEDLARSKRMMNSVLASCNPLDWNEWLADDAVLSLRLGTVDTSEIRGFRGYSGVFRAAGKRQARRMLKSISGGLSKDLSISTEIISGSHIILLGKLAAQGGAQCMPVVIYMALTLEKKIQDMTIAIVDMQTITAAMKFS